MINLNYRSSHPEVFLGKGILKICSKCTGEHSCRSAISIKLQSSCFEITLWHGCSPVNLLHIFRTPFSKNTSGQLLLELPEWSYSVWDIQHYSEHISKKYEEETDNPSIRIYVNKIEKRISFKIKTRHHIEILTHETMELLESTKSKITNDKIAKIYLI